MDSKLTLKLSDEIIKRAKKYAADKNVSLSRLVERYFNSLTQVDENNSEIEISPFVKNMTKGGKVPVNLDTKKDYRESRLKKHQ